jgi:iron(III) transport system ATP-binding protein
MSLMAHLELEGIVQRYGSHTVVDGVSFRVESGSIACLLGPSGCGKTTLLRCIAGFEDIAAGEIRVQGDASVRAGRRLPPEQRQIGMVFQDYALFPHLTVAANVGFGLAGLAASERRSGSRTARHGRPRWPGRALSARTLRWPAAARRAGARPGAAPALILLDEPFSNLDVDLRERLSLEVREILKSQNITAVLVTHDQHEAFAMADEVGVMADGTHPAVGYALPGLPPAGATASSPTSSARGSSCPAW